VDLDAIEAVKDLTEIHRANLELSEVQDLTDMVVKHSMTQADAAAHWNRTQESPEKKVALSTVSKYVRHFQENKDYFSPQKRGPKGLLSDAEKEDLLRLTAMMRRLGWQLCAKRFRALARGIALAKETIVKSWARTGITLALTGEQPTEIHKGQERQVPIVFQEYEQAYAEDGDLDAIVALGEAEEEPAPVVAVPPAAVVIAPRTAVEALQALAPPPPAAKKAPGRPPKPKEPPKPPTGCQDIRKFFRVVKRDREDGGNDEI